MSNTLMILRQRLRHGIGVRSVKDLREESASVATDDLFEDATDDDIDLSKIISEYKDKMHGAVRVKRFRKGTKVSCGICGSSAVSGVKLHTGEYLCRSCESKVGKKLSTALGGMAMKTSPGSGRYVVSSDGDDAILQFGKHVGKSVSELQRTDPSYLDWMMHQDFPHELIDIIRHVKGIGPKKSKRKPKRSSIY